MNKFFRWFYFKVLKWKLIGEMPKIDKMILPVIPHTHWNDFFMGIIIRNVIDEKINFVGKKEIFGPLTGWFFKIMGGTSVKRNSKSNTVNSIADIFKRKRVFRLALAPEGTRKKVDKWKTGFYFIALNANIPVCLFKMDYVTKEIGFFNSINFKGDFKKEMKFIEDQYKNHQGKILANYNPKIF